MSRTTATSSGPAPSDLSSVSTTGSATSAGEWTELFREIVEESLAGVYLLQRGRFVYVNRCMAEMFGYTREELLNLSSHEDLVYEADQQLVNDHILLRLKGGARTVQYEYRGRRKDGRIITLEVHGGTTTYQDGPAVFGIMLDVTERKQTEQALLEASGRLRLQAQLLDSVRESVVATDLDGHITFWGKGARVLFGYEADEALGHQFARLVVPDEEMATFREGGEEAAALASGGWTGESLRRRKDGSQFWAEIFLARVNDEQGRPCGFIGLHRDVTERRRIQQELARSRESLRNLTARLIAVREEERSAIAREIHDELGQALTTMRIDLSWLAKHLEPGQAVERVESVTELVDRTLGTVRQIATRMRPAILDDLGLEAAIEWQAQEFSTRSGCRCRLDVQLGGLVLDPQRSTAIFRILQEALTNIARHAQATTAAVKLLVVEDAVRLTVQDNGIGIGKLDLTSSSSLGLIGMRERAGALGGRVSIQRRRRSGTMVTLRMPIRQDSEEPAERQA